MKILLHAGSKSNPGGVENYVFNLAKELKLLGCEVETIFGKTGSIRPDYTYLENYHSKLWNIDPIVPSLLLYNKIKDIKYDIIHSQAQWSYDVAVLKRFLPKIKFIYTIHGLEHALEKEWRKEYELQKKK